MTRVSLLDALDRGSPRTLILVSLSFSQSIFSGFRSLHHGRQRQHRMAAGNLRRTHLCTMPCECKNPNVVTSLRITSAAMGSV